MRGYTVLSLTVIPWFQNSSFISAQYLENYRGSLMELDQILHMHWPRPDLQWDCYGSILANKQESYSPWLLRKFTTSTRRGNCFQLVPDSVIPTSFPLNIENKFRGKFIGIDQIYIGIVMPQFCKLTTVIALCFCQNLYSVNILWTSWRNLIKFCIYIYLSQI